MNKQRILCLTFVLGLASTGYAQFSAGVMAGSGYLWERQTSVLFGYTIGGVDAAQPLLMGGVFGQYATKGKWGVVAGLQLRYQWQRQSQRFATGNPSNPFELTDAQYNRYSYAVATPYIGIRPFGRLEIAAGPEINLLLQSRLVTPGRAPARWIVGYNVKATYWFGRLGIEGGYSHQNTAFDSDGQLNGQPVFQFYNRFVYGMVKYKLTR